MIDVRFSRIGKKATDPTPVPDDSTVAQAAKICGVDYAQCDLRVTSMSADGVLKTVAATEDTVLRHGDVVTLNPRIAGG